MTDFSELISGVHRDGDTWTARARKDECSRLLFRIFENMEVSLHPFICPVRHYSRVGASPLSHIDRPEN